MPTERTAPPEVVVAVTLVEHAGRVLVRKREAGKHLAGLWEFPGGKLEPGESPVDAAVRETREEVGFTPRDLAPFGAWSHDYVADGVRVTLHAFTARFPEGARVKDPSARWVTLAELAALDMPAGNAPILAALRA